MARIIIEDAAERAIITDIREMLRAVDSGAADGVTVNGFWSGWEDEAKPAHPPFVYVVVSPFMPQGYGAHNGTADMTIMGKVIADDDSDGAVRREMYAAVMRAIRAARFVGALDMQGIGLQKLLLQSSDAAPTEHGDVWTLSYQLQICDQRKEGDL